MAQRAGSAVLLGGAFIAVWGAELVQSIFGFLDMSNHSLLSSGVMRDYEEYVTGWMLVRVVISSVGVLAGVLILRGRRLGYWLGAGSALLLLTLATDYGWYVSLASGKLTPRFLFVMAPGLGYSVIVFPVLVGTLLILTVINLAKRRPSAPESASAI